MSTSCDSQHPLPSTGGRPGISESTIEKRPIVLIAETLGPGRGGAELYLGHLTRFLANEGHPVQVFVRRRCPEAVAAADADRVRVEVVPTMRRFRVVWERPFARRVARRLAASHPGIVMSTLPLPGITHYQPHSGLYQAAFEATHRSMDPGLARKFDHLGHNLNLRRQTLIKMQEQLLKPGGPQVMTFSNAVRAQFLGAHPSLSSRVVTVPQGVDLARFHPGREASGMMPTKRTPGRLTLLFVAQNFRLKGLRCLLAAFAEALRQGLNADLMIVGTRTGSNRNFPSLARRMRLSSHVHFLGSIPDAEMPGIYRSCDAFVHPTFSDHCSLVVLEALACGLPVITTRQNGAAELMAEGREGRILDRPDDVPALAAALLHLQNAQALAAMSAAAVRLRPHIDFQLHARRVAAWLTGGPSEGSLPASESPELKPRAEVA